MSYIINSTSPFVSIKLTEKGREQLALGRLSFNFWSLGDSEINYSREEIVDENPTSAVLSATSMVLRPVDRQPNIKSFITKSTSTSQYQTIGDSNSSLNVIKATVNNEATERGFFTNQTTGFTTSLSSTLTPYYQTVANTTLTGGTTLTLSSVSNVSVGDFILLKVVNSAITTTISASATTTPIPNLWYKVQAINGNTLTVDRTVPSYSGDGASSFVILYKGGEVYNTIGTGNTTAYWDTGTLAFNSSVNVTCHDVPVWNMNNVWCENMAGMSSDSSYEDYTKFGSYSYLGTKNPFLDYLCTSTGISSTQISCVGGSSYIDDVSKSISIIHYTNNTISNLYGEFFYVDATNSKYVKLHLPNIMYHRRSFSTASGTTMGMTFIASGATQLLPDTDIEYIDLIESPEFVSGSTQMTVGKVFPQLKIIVIDDDEIVAATSYKSNRNWTLPELSANLASPSGGTSTGILAEGKTMYLTYSLENNNITKLASSLPCQKYTKITNNTSSAKDIEFKISETDLLPYMRKIELAEYDGLGFYATNFKLLYQIVDNATDRPDSSAWSVYDFTSTAITSVASKSINPKLLENQIPSTNGFVLDLIKDSSSTTFDLIPLLNMAPNNQPTYLQFGDERFFYGNLQTYIGARIYKTVFDISVDSSQFNTTSNSTRSEDVTTNPPNIKISEVGIYDSSQNLVCIGKLSTPVPLLAGNTITLELSLDF